MSHTARDARPLRGYAPSIAGIPGNLAGGVRAA